MKCNERCLELRLGDQCGRCGGLVDVRKPADGLSPSQRLMLGESMRRLPRFTDAAIAELDREAREDLDEELALANLQLAHDVVASMSEGPKPRAADDADGIQKAMREIHDRERRRPIACAPGQHDFRWEDGVYTCRHCLRGKREDGR